MDEYNLLYGNLDQRTTNTNPNHYIYDIYANDKRVEFKADNIHYDALKQIQADVRNSDNFKSMYNAYGSHMGEEFIESTATGMEVEPMREY